MKNSLKVAAVAALALCTTATGAFADECRDNRAAGTVLGAIAGGVLGGAISHGNGGAVVGGVILGGIAGHEIASNIDCSDRPYAYRVYREALDGPVGERYEWEHHGHHGYIVTHREYWRGDHLCRDFTVVTWRHGDEYSRDGTACRYEGGEWHFM
jgi:surface antigen